MEPTSTISRYLPGLDLADAVRQRHAKGDHIGALRYFRTLTGASLSCAADWYEALTDWQRPGRPAATVEPTPQPLTKADLAEAFRSFSRKLTDRGDKDGDAAVYMPLFAVAGQAVTLADDLDAEGQAVTLADDLDAEGR